MHNDMHVYDMQYIHNLHTHDAQVAYISFRLEHGLKQTAVRLASLKLANNGGVVPFVFEIA